MLQIRSTLTGFSPPAAPESAGVLAGRSAAPRVRSDRHPSSPARVPTPLKPLLSYYQVVTTADSFALVLELLSWVALVPGVILLVVGYARRAFASRFQETWGVIIPSPAGTAHPWFRWMDLGRELRSAPVPMDADESLAVGDEVKVYFDPRNPDHGRLDHPSSDGRLLRILGWVLAGIGAAAGVIQFITLIVG